MDGQMGSIAALILGSYFAVLKLLFLHVQPPVMITHMNCNT
jgi:hypothetical protein